MNTGKTSEENCSMRCGMAQVNPICHFQKLTAWILEGDFIRRYQEPFPHRDAAPLAVRGAGRGFGGCCQDFYLAGQRWCQAAPTRPSPGGLLLGSFDGATRRP